MRRHYANYFKGIPHFKDYRMQLVKLDQLSDIEEVLSEIESNFANLEAIY
jgi:tRNA-dihydrouridine synthase B